MICNTKKNFKCQFQILKVNHYETMAEIYIYTRFKEFKLFYFINFYYIKNTVILHYYAQLRGNHSCTINERLQKAI